MIRIALPRGDLRGPLASTLEEVGFEVVDYGSGSRAYRFNVKDRNDMTVRVFSDRDIPIQVASGNYDLAICSRISIDELLTRYPKESIVPLRMINLSNVSADGSDSLVIGGAIDSDLSVLGSRDAYTVTTEFPNIALRYLTEMQARNYRILDVWAQPEAWPPEDADFTIATESAAAREGLQVLSYVHRGGIWLIANKNSLAMKNLSHALGPLLSMQSSEQNSGLVHPEPVEKLEMIRVRARTRQQDPDNTVRIAVPDGHAQRHTVKALADAGIVFDGYDETVAVRRPSSSDSGISVKVFRPQDMPRAVAMGLFDLAMTGRDWLENFLSLYPEAPVEELVDLGRSEYKLGAVISNELDVDSMDEAITEWRRDDPDRVIRVTSEYAALADKYARTNRLGRYSVIPISGASEGFVPEDAEILIEGTETGATLAANNLSMIDVMIWSTNCIIGRKGGYPDRQQTMINSILDKF